MADICVRRERRLNNWLEIKPSVGKARAARGLSEYVLEKDVEDYTRQCHEAQGKYPSTWAPVMPVVQHPDLICFWASFLKAGAVCSGIFGDSLRKVWEVLLEC